MLPPDAPYADGAPKLIPGAGGSFVSSSLTSFFNETTSLKP